MKKTESESITETKQVVITTCDFCGREHRGTYTGIKECKICKRDVCSRCAIKVDFECDLSKAFFYSDYPEYICIFCWNEGKEIRQEIMTARDAADDAESVLLDAWEILCRVERNSN